MRKSTLFVSAVMTTFVLAVIFGVASLYQKDLRSGDDTGLPLVSYVSIPNDIDPIYPAVGNPAFMDNGSKLSIVGGNYEFYTGAQLDVPMKIFAAGDSEFYVPNLGYLHFGQCFRWEGLHTLLCNHKNLFIAKDQ